MVLFEFADGHWVLEGDYMPACDDFFSREKDKSASLMKIGCPLSTLCPLSSYLVTCSPLVSQSGPVFEVLVGYDITPSSEMNMSCEAAGTGEEMIGWPLSGCSV